MSDTRLAELPAAEVAARWDAMRDAMASARIEGVNIPPEARAIMELHDLRRIGDEEMMRRFCELDIGE